MALQLEIVSENRDIVGDDYVRLFEEDGGTIGRALENDWILPDPDLFISGKHARIDFQDSAYYLVDVSTNGVYVNDDRIPLGKGNPRRLFEGDRIRMGDFEFVVSLDESDGLALPPESPATVAQDHIDQLVSDNPEPAGAALLEAEKATSDEEFQNALFGSGVKPALPKEGSMNNAPNPFANKTEQTTQALEIQTILDAFLDGLGIERSELRASTDPVELMGNAGRVFKQLVEGITEMLVARASVKAMFRLDQTIVLPQNNNPMKLAENTRDSILQLLVGAEDEYLAPLDAVKEACRDLKFHHDALLEGISQAFAEFSERFDPDDLKENFDRTLNKKPLFNKVNQLKYWQLYCDLYPIMTEPGSGPFPHHFGEDFVRAYEKQIADYKRHENIYSSVPQNKASNDDHQSGEELVDQVDHGPEW